MSVDLLVARTSLADRPGWSSIALEVLGLVDALAGDRGLHRPVPLRADLGVLVGALRCRPVICHPDFVVLVKIVKLKGILRLTTAALHLCDVELIGPLRSRSFALGVG